MKNIKSNMKDNLQILFIKICIMEMHARLD